MRRSSAGFSPLISIDRQGDRPLHRQIYDALRAAIVAGELNPAQQVPSTRALATELRVSRIPVLQAYDQLLAEGYFTARGGAGTFVSGALPERLGPANDRNAIAAVLGSPLRRVSLLSLRVPRYQRPDWIRGQGPFNVSQPALEAFPFKTWAALAARFSRNPLATSLHYGDPMGLRALRDAIAVYLRTSRAVRCEWQQVMIVSGSQQALDLSARVLLDADSPVWIEEPGYWLARHILVALGCRVIPVPVDSEGLDVAAGIKRSPKARAAFVAPSHQYPLGVTMTASRRLQLLEWARHSGSWIVEDDYDSEYRYDSNPVASLQGLDHSSRVVYIGTFSKVLFPSLRIGYVVVPPDLVDHFLAVRHAMDVSPPHFHQAVLADFISEGHFSRHIRRMRVLYGERRTTLVDLLKRDFGSLLEVIGAEAGMYLAVKLPKGFNDEDISTRAARHNLWLWPLSPAYLERTSHGFILGFGSTTSAEMSRAVHQLRMLIG